MSRKHFQLIAATIRNAPYTDAATRKSMALTFSIALSRDNPRFDAARFLVACGAA